MISFEKIWARIKANEGNTFRQAFGPQFTYSISGSTIIPSTTNQNIPQTHFEEAFIKLPQLKTVLVQHLSGASYIYTLLMDVRIRQKDW